MRHIWTGFFRTSLAVAISIASFGALSLAPAAADAAPTFLAIDKDSKGVTPAFPGDFESIKDAAKRKALKDLADQFGRELIVDAGAVGKELWVAPQEILPAWVAAGPTTDGLSNLWLHAVAGDKTYDALKDLKFDATPMGAELADLAGRTVCALIADVKIEHGLQAKLGGGVTPIAFDVLAVTPLDVIAAGKLPVLRVRVVDPAEACSGDLLLFSDPEAGSSGNGSGSGNGNGNGNGTGNGNGNGTGNGTGTGNGNGTGTGSGNGTGNGPDTIQSFIETFYREVLGRLPTESELAAWLAFLRNNPGANGATSLAEGFLNSEEIFHTPLTLAEYVRILYRTILQREPAESEVEFWVNTGLLPVLNSLVPGFVNSPEFQQLTLTTPPSVVVNRLYVNVLGRQETLAENQAWVDIIIRTNDWIGVALGFLDSPEYVGGERRFADHVTILYRTFLGREPETAGLNGWLNIIADGLKNVQNAFTNSPEFQTRILRLFQ